jgi:adenosylcobyric acid synthase
VGVVVGGVFVGGGVIAALVGTHAVIEPAERARIRGFLVNKFRGDARLFDDGVTAIEQRTAWPCLGVVPWLPEAAWLPAEDAVDLERAGETKQAGLKVVVPMLSRIANFDDLDPLGMEPGVQLAFVRPGEPIPGDADVVILPGSKSTIGDLAFLRAQGWDIDMTAHVRRGGHVLGLCGGYQMLGRTISDPLGIEGPAGSVAGLGLLNVVTEMTAEKSTTHVAGRHVATGTAIRGYEIHLGHTKGDDCARPVLTIGTRPDGAASRDGRVQGTYVHGFFTSDGFRRAWLAGFGVASQVAYEDRVERALDALADHLEAHLDVARIIEIARSR